MKCKMTGVCDSMEDRLSKLRDLPLLFMRLVLAYGFWTTGMMKWSGIENVASWFESMGYPFPTLNAYLAAGTEVGGAMLLLLGFGTRLITLPLMFVMLIAIFTVHLSGGFNAGDNGFEIPLYYLIMLFGLFVYGAGNYSLIGLIKKFQN